MPSSTDMIKSKRVEAWTLVSSSTTRSPGVGHQLHRNGEALTLLHAEPRAAASASRGVTDQPVCLGLQVQGC